MSVNMEAWRSMDGSEGFVCLPFIHLIFQRGPVHEVGVNGTRVEDVIEVLTQRLLDHQGRELACEENAIALEHLEKAREALMVRRRRRLDQGRLNTPEHHATEAVVEPL